MSDVTPNLAPDLVLERTIPGRPSGSGGVDPSRSC
jgi:hypothetical protein